MERLLQRTKTCLMENQGYLPRMILVAPPAVQRGVLTGPFSEEFNDRQLAVSAALPTELGKVAEKMGCEFVDLSGDFVFWGIDFEHFTPADTFRFAHLLAEKIMGE